VKLRAIWLCTVLLVGCGAAPTPSPEPFAVVPADPTTVVRNGGDPVTSLRATFLARVRTGDGVESARGVLLVSKPDRFRMRLSSLFGLTILDYLSNSDDDRLWLASADRILVGDEIARSAAFSPDAVRWIFLRHRRLQQSCVEINGGDDAVVECTDGPGRVIYRGYVQRSSGLLQREIMFDERPQLTVTYGDYRVTEGVRLPYSIEWIEAASGVRVRIEVSRYEVAPRLSDELFAPAGR
jgi:outer membrane lipoprotein-sorting protein